MKWIQQRYLQVQIKKYALLFLSLLEHRHNKKSSIYFPSLILTLVQIIFPLLCLWFLTFVMADIKPFQIAVYMPRSIQKNVSYLVENPLNRATLNLLYRTIDHHQEDISSLGPKLNELLSLRGVPSKTIDIINSCVEEVYSQYFYNNMCYKDGLTQFILNQMITKNTRAKFMGVFPLLPKKTQRGRTSPLGSAYSVIVYPLLHVISKMMLMQLIAGMMPLWGNTSLVPFFNGIVPYVTLYFCYTFMTLIFSSTQSCFTMIYSFLNLNIQTVVIPVKVWVYLVLFLCLYKDLTTDILANITTHLGELSLGFLNALPYFNLPLYPLVSLKRTSPGNSKWARFFFSSQEQHSFNKRVYFLFENSCCRPILGVIRPIKTGYLNIPAVREPKFHIFHYIITNSIDDHTQDTQYCLFSGISILKLVFYIFNCYNEFQRILQEYNVTERTYNSYKLWAPKGVSAFHYSICYVLSNTIVNSINAPVKLAIYYLLGYHLFYAGKWFKDPYVIVFQILILWKFISKNKTNAIATRDSFKYLGLIICLNYLLEPMLLYSRSLLNYKYTQSVYFLNIRIIQSQEQFRGLSSIIQKLILSIIMNARDSVPWCDSFSIGDCC